MPIYEYRPSGERHCAFCVDGFERLRKLQDPPLERCPRCDAPIERCISAPNLAKVSPSMSESNIEKHGFTQYRKVEKGVYEKTVGKGPKVISGD